jgi:hypothetical protein
MKNVILALGLLMILAGCGKSASGNNNAPPPNSNGQGFAAVGLPPECASPNQRSMPNQYQQSGCSPYNWDNGRIDHGGCPRHTVAACAAGVGMICVPQDTYGTNQVAWYNEHDGNIGRACLVGTNDCGYGNCQPLEDRGNIRGGNWGNDRGNDRGYNQGENRGDRRDGRGDAMRNNGADRGDWRRPPRLLHIGVCVQ